MELSTIDIMRALEDARTTVHSIRMGHSGINGAAWAFCNRVDDRIVEAQSELFSTLLPERAA